MTSRELYLRLLTHVRPYWKGLPVAMVCMGLASLAEPIFPAMMKSCSTMVFVGQRPVDWLFYPLAIMGLFLVRAVFGFTSATT